MFPKQYRILDQNVFSLGEYSIIPIRYQDRLDIMKWRNEQMYHLRQSEFLSEIKQDNYFNNVLLPLFNEDKPNQILFSYLKGNDCIGYGGLVHINWIDLHAEISFIMNTVLEKDYFEENWSNYLDLIEKVAFKEIGLHKIFTYAYDIRKNLFKTLDKKGFELDASLKDHCFFNGNFIDVKIHCKLNTPNELIKLEKVNLDHSDLILNWANDPTTRMNSVNENLIEKTDHTVWFRKKINDSECYFYILMKNNTAIGQIRLDKMNECWEISFSIAKEYRGQGFGKKIVSLAIQKHPNLSFSAIVKEGNETSIKIFKSLNFSQLPDTRILGYLTFKKTSC